MEQRVLGASGLTVSSLALGTMTFGVETDEAGAAAQLDRFVEAGGTLIDTADVYGAGRSEEIVGRWLATRGRHDDLVIATKGRFPMGEGPLDRGAGRRHLQRAEMHGWTAPVSLQPQYNLLAREIEWELVPQCLEEGLGLLPWSPLGGGWLTGKYRRDERPTGATRLGEDPERGVKAYDRRNTERTWAVIDRVRAVAEAHGCSLGQVALAWVRQRPSVSSVVLGARTVDQLDDNLRSADVTLSDEQMDDLSVVSAPGIADYPYRMLARQCGMSVWDELRTRPAPD